MYSQKSSNPSIKRAVSVARLRSVFPFFKEIAPEALEPVASRIVEKSYPKGSLIFLEGSFGEEIYFILSGSVSVFTLNKTKKVVLSTLGEGDYFGEMALINPEAGRSTAAEALTAVRVYTLKKQDFLTLFGQDRNLLQHLLVCTMDRLSKANRQIYDLTFLSVRARIMKRLLALGRQASLPDGRAPVPVRITHQQLADMVGAVRETVSKIVHELQEEGLIALRHRMIYLNDPALLEARLEEEL